MWSRITLQYVNNDTFKGNGKYKYMCIYIYIYINICKYACIYILIDEHKLENNITKK